MHCALTAAGPTSARIAVDPEFVNTEDRSCIAENVLARIVGVNTGYRKASVAFAARTEFRIGIEWICHQLSSRMMCL
jgi:hypothetical protein